MKELCDNEAVKTVYLKRLDAYGRKNGLNSLEILKKIHLETESLVLKGLTTTTFKVVRAKCKVFYKDTIEAMYA